jgi:hypothetical protein
MKHIIPIKSIPTFRCQHCGSSNVKININGTIIDPKTPNILKITNELKNIKISCIWECFGKCEDETSATMTVDGKIFNDPKDVLKYLSGSKIKISIKKAIELGDVGTLKEYIDAGNSVDSYIQDTPNYDGNQGDFTLLGYAVEKSKLNIVEFLVSHKCDVNKKSDRDDRYNFTPLTLAMWALCGNARQRVERTKILDILLENGADPYITDNSGDNSFDWILKGRNKTNCENLGYRQKLEIYIKEKLK